MRLRWTEEMLAEARSLMRPGASLQVASDLSRAWGLEVTQGALLAALARSDTPAQDTSLAQSIGPSQNYLIIPDLQIPFEHPKALPFLLDVKREYRVPDENVLCVGDETDCYFASLFDKDPDGVFSADSELNATKERLRRFYSAFPRVRLADSNHPARIAKRISGAGLPSQVARAYREIIEAPEGWRWARSWLIEGRKPFLLAHGHEGQGGIYSYRMQALTNGISTVIGHHTTAGIAHVRTQYQEIWGMCVGALIDRDAYAFHYAQGSAHKAFLGCGVVLNGGTTPLLVPLG